MDQKRHHNYKRDEKFIHDLESLIQSRYWPYLYLEPLLSHSFK